MTCHLSPTPLPHRRRFGWRGQGEPFLRAVPPLLHENLASAHDLAQGWEDQHEHLPPPSCSLGTDHHLFEPQFSFWWWVRGTLPGLTKIIVGSGGLGQSSTCSAFVWQKMVLDQRSSPWWHIRITWGDYIFHVYTHTHTHTPWFLTWTN